MPNWVYNTLHITGKPARVTEIKDKAYYLQMKMLWMIRQKALLLPLTMALILLSGWNQAVEMTPCLRKLNFQISS